MEKKNRKSHRQIESPFIIFIYMKYIKCLTEKKKLSVQLTRPEKNTPNNIQLISICIYYIYVDIIYMLCLYKFVCTVVYKYTHMYI